MHNITAVTSSGGENALIFSLGCFVMLFFLHIQPVIPRLKVSCGGIKKNTSAATAVCSFFLSSL